jgi:hypothetical protein
MVNGFLFSPRLNEGAGMTVPPLDATPFMGSILD